MVTMAPDASSLAEVLDRILDKGVVVDVWARISLVGIEILTVESRVVVASVDTFLTTLKRWPRLSRRPLARPLGFCLEQVSPNLFLEEPWKTMEAPG